MPNILFKVKCIYVLLIWELFFRNGFVPQISNWKLCGYSSFCTATLSWLFSTLYNILTTLPLKDFIYLFLERRQGREKEREREKHQCVVASHVPPTRDLAHNPGMCPDWESNQWHFGSQASSQSLSHTSQAHFTFLMDL